MSVQREGVLPVVYISFRDSRFDLHSIDEKSLSHQMSQILFAQRWPAIDHSTPLSTSDLSFKNLHQLRNDSLSERLPSSCQCIREESQSTASTNRRFVCYICSISFNYKTSFNRHMRNHQSKKSFVCNECDAKFSQHENLKRHHLVHSGEKPFSCDTCGKQFTQKSNMKKHQSVCDKVHSILSTTNHTNHNRRQEDETHRCVYRHKKFGAIFVNSR